MPNLSLHFYVYLSRVLRLDKQLLSPLFRVPWWVRLDPPLPLRLRLAPRPSLLRPDLPRDDVLPPPRARQALHAQDSVRGLRWSRVPVVVAVAAVRDAAVRVGGAGLGAEPEGAARGGAVHACGQWEDGVRRRRFLNLSLMHTVTLPNR